MIREWLARKLAPETFKDAEKYDYLRRRLDELQTWCGYEAPEIDNAIVWAKNTLRVHFMPLSEYYERCENREFDLTHVGDISKFREDMRARAKRKDAA